MLEGKITIRLDDGKNEENWELIVGCNLPGKWVLHWGVNHVGGVGSEWDQPHSNMRPPGPIPIKDYAIETPFQRLSSSLEGEVFYEVKIDIDTSSSIAAINFVLKDEENRKWYHHRGRDFKVPLIDYPCDAGYVVKVRKGLDKWSGTFGKISNILIKPETIDSKGDSWKSNLQEGSLQALSKGSKNVVYIDTDIPEDVVIHWGGRGRRDGDMTWKVPVGPHPPETIAFRNKAFQTLFRKKDDGHGSRGSFTLQEGKWYMELNEKASELSSLGITVLWLPPPIDSVSPEGYMPRDLYNLNSRYGDIDQLMTLVKRLRKVGLKVLGDVVLNHICAQYKNQSGVWNIFGGRLNWDDYAVVSDEPHFQGGILCILKINSSFLFIF